MLSNDRKALFCVSVVTVLAIQPSAQKSVSTTQQSMSTAVIPTKCVPKIKPPGNTCNRTQYYDEMNFDCRPCSRCCKYSGVVSECEDGCMPSSHTCAEEDKCRVHCGPPPVLDQPNYKPSLKEYDEYDVVKYYCPPGYMLSENVTSQCVEPGNWYPVPPSCLKVYHCEQPPRVDYASYVPEKDRYDVMENITFSCADFHKLSGNMTIYCGPTGEWFKLPSCDLEVWKVVAVCVGILAMIRLAS
ncbi:unnamed protein product [Owenia fusiformis]|uniref:Uncharacterized protein n=1 Tax=Owenia fusiformis TaxID=6347 RepID=A0A8J1XFF5_OWEFU|nr:unnamed protein product [Owenia fusiformis]